MTRSHSQRLERARHTSARTEDPAIEWSTLQAVRTGPAGLRDLRGRTGTQDAEHQVTLRGSALAPLAEGGLDVPSSSPEGPGKTTL